MLVRIEFRLRTAIVILVCVLLAVTGGSAFAQAFLVEDVPYDQQADSVELEDGSTLWPYTSADTRFDERTLAINLVVYGPAELTEFVLRGDPGREWRDIEEEREDVAPAEGLVAQLNESSMGLAAAAGSDRWIWVDPVDGDPRWLAESYQLEEGDYLGQRHHVRAYVDPSNRSWTALQAHSEHWDWFHLRHTVHSIEDSQLVVEEAFLDRMFVDSLHRERYGNDRSSDGDGWVTVVALDETVLPPLFGFLAFGVASVVEVLRSREVGDTIRTNPTVGIGVRALAAALSIVLGYHLIRFGAIGAERYFPGMAAKTIVAACYPVLVVGLPVVAYLSSRPLDATLAFAAAVIGFVVAVFLDYTYLGVVRIPLETFVHRGALAVAIGLIAAGASETAREPGEKRGYVREGVLLWLVAIALPLAQFV